jgi:hypothetical protein
MEQLNAKFDSILQEKCKEIAEIALSKNKNKKMIDNVNNMSNASNVSNVSNELGYGVKTTLYKINAEQERKLKASKAYKKKEEGLS